MVMDVNKHRSHPEHVRDTAVRKYKAAVEKIKCD